MAWLTGYSLGARVSEPLSALGSMMQRAAVTRGVLRLPRGLAAIAMSRRFRARSGGCAAEGAAVSDAWVRGGEPSLNRLQASGSGLQQDTDEAPIMGPEARSPHTEAGNETARQLEPGGDCGSAPAAAQTPR